LATMNIAELADLGQIVGAIGVMETKPGAA
jgi:hypothetical protein